MDPKIKELQDAISRSEPRPRGVKVSTELWHSLQAAELMKYKEGLSTKWPYLDGDIYLIHDLMLDGSKLDYELPPNTQN